MKSCALAVLLCLSAGFPAAAAVLLYEPFDYNDGPDPIALQNNGGTSDFGFEAGSVWVREEGLGTRVRSGSLDSPAFPFSPVGGKIDDDTSGGYGSRVLGFEIDAAVEDVTYFSVLMSKDAIDEGSSENVELQLWDRDYNGTAYMRYRMGMTSDDQFFCVVSGTTSYPKTGSIVPGEVYFLVAKLVTHADTTEDETFMSVFGPGDAVPSAEPETWDQNMTGRTNVSFDQLRVQIGTNNARAAVDEIRIGETWADVAVPEPASLLLLGLGLAWVRGREARG